MSNKNVVVVILLVAITAAGFISYQKGWLFNKQVKDRNVFDLPPATSTPVSRFIEANPPKVTKFEGKTIPTGFPADLVFEKDATVLENYKVEKFGVVEFNRKYISKKTMEQNLALFKNYFEKNWSNASVDSQNPNMVRISSRTNLSMAYVLLSKTEEMLTVEIKITNIKS